MAVDSQFRKDWIEVQQEQGTDTQEAEFLSTAEGIETTLALPGIKYNKDPIEHDDAVPEYYVQIPYAVLAHALETLQNNAAAIMLDWNGDGTEEHPGMEPQVRAAITGAETVNALLSGTTLTVIDRNGTPYSVDTKGEKGEKGDKGDKGNKGDAFTYADFTSEQISDLKRPATDAAAEWTNTNKPQVTAATNAANTAATGAEKVNASLVGMTVTITNRNGVSNSVNIGFAIYRTYASVAAMNADAVNVPEGKFVIIATTNATDPDNAKLYCKNSSGGFTFLCDLDQASAAAWADWLENMKPQIESALATADSDHTRAGQDHNTAVSDHSTAQSDHQTATSDHTQAGTDHTTAVSDHNKAVTDHTTAGTDHTTAQSDHSTASTDHSRAETDHNTATQDHTTAGQDHTRAESDHTRAEQDHTRAGQDHSTASSDHEISAQQQSTFEANEAQRQQDFEDAEEARMANMILTRPFVDPATMCLMFVQPQQDKTKYQVLQGCLNITIQYEQQ